MFGMEKKPRNLFEFDLEKDMKSDSVKATKNLKIVEEKIHEIKQVLRQGTSSEDYEQYGVLLHGFMALQKVLKKIIQK